MRRLDVGFLSNTVKKSTKSTIWYDICIYCKGSCVVSQQKADDYDPDNIDEVDCPHCDGRGQTGLAGDFCKLCKGKQVVSRAVLEAYHEQYKSR